MSSTNGGGERRAYDFYPTPEWCVHALLREWQPRHCGRWLEPCAGDGAIIRAVHTFGLAPSWTAVELRSEAFEPISRTAKSITPNNPPMEIDVHCPENFLLWKPSEWETGIHGKYDLCLTNPPFLFAQQFIEHSLEMCDQVAMLLRLNFIGSQERVEWHKKHVADLYPLTPRPGFTEDGGTDSTEYAWWIWPGTGRYKLLDAVDLRDRWLAEREHCKRKQPVNTDVSELPLFKGAG